MSAFIFSKSGDPAQRKESISDQKVDIENLDEINSIPSDEDSANRMLAELLKFFLVDVALRLSDENQKLLVQKFDSKCESRGDIIERDKPISERSPKGKDLLVSIERLKVAAAKLKSVDARDAETLANQLQVENFFAVLKSTKNTSFQFFQQLDGEYIGQIRPIDSGEGPWDSTMSFKITKASRAAQDIEADFSFTWKRNGRESNTSHNGKIQHNFSQIEGLPRSIVFAVSGGDWYLNLFLSDDGRHLLGNAYKKHSVDNYLPIGSVHLERSR